MQEGWVDVAKKANTDCCVVPSNTNRVLVPLMESLCALLRYAHEVYFDRIGRRMTEKSERAADSIRAALQVVLDVMHVLTKSVEQARLIARNIVSLERACDLKRWRSFCGRTHTVPVDLIEALRAEVLKIKEME